MNTELHRSIVKAYELVLADIDTHIYVSKKEHINPEQAQRAALLLVAHRKQLIALLALCQEERNETTHAMRL